MPKIAISYRRSDSQDITGRINDHLVPRFGRDAVFRDIDSMRPGMDFREQIAQAIDATDVLLVIVGPNWFGQCEGGEARIENAADPVRIEVESALARKIPVIPVLVGGMQMPTVRQLPEGLRDLAYRHAVVIDGGRDFDHHMSGLIKSLERIFESTAAREVSGRPKTRLASSKATPSPLKDAQSKTAPPLDTTAPPLDKAGEAKASGPSLKNVAKTVLTVFSLMTFLSLGLGVMGGRNQSGGAGAVFLLLAAFCGLELYRRSKGMAWSQLLARERRRSPGSDLDSGSKS